MTIKPNIQKSKDKHIMPARLSKKKYNEVLNIAKKTHEVLNCRGVTRSDFKFLKIIFIIRTKYSTRYDKFIFSS